MWKGVPRGDWHLSQWLDKEDRPSVRRPPQWAEGLQGTGGGEKGIPSLGWSRGAHLLAWDIWLRLLGPLGPEPCANSSWVLRPWVLD